MGILDDLKEHSADTGVVEFFPGSRKPLVRHPNRHLGVEDRPNPDHWDSKSRKFPVNGVEREFFTIGQLAQALGRRPVTIRTWERDKVIPNATYRFPGKTANGVRRLYTREQVEGLVKIALEEGLLNGDNRSITATDFTRRAFDLFRSLPA